MKIEIQKILLSLALLLLTVTAFGQDLQTLPALNSRVTDLTSTLSNSEINNLEQTLANFEKVKGSQVVVLILPSTEPEEIVQFGIRLAEKWKVGRENIDDAVILIIAKDDRKIRIEVGYGLEGAIPDIYAKRIIENIIIPDFRQGQFYEGIADGVGAIISLIQEEELPEVTSSSSVSGSENNMFTVMIIVLFIFGSIVKALVKKKGVKWGIVGVMAIIVGLISGSIIMGVIISLFSSVFLFMPTGSGVGRGRYRGYGYGYGGFSSGGGFGGGGFSGGGGSFGGGGASGGW